ncbi:MAG TPA: leucyl aminopeptidase family protein [Rhizomicrobium sp.]|nr:leucyl aminopeptidase family protein [Rhizomicrobium sp.]
MHESLVRSAKGATRLHAVKASGLKRWRAALPRREAQWLENVGFAAKDGELVLIPGARGVSAAVLGLGKGEDRLALAQFSESLPQGTYALGDVPESHAGANAALAWLLGTYRFGRYKKVDRKSPRLVAPAGVDAAEVTRIAEGVFLARDLVNTPSNDMGPEELAAAARDLAKRHGAKFALTLGEDLLKKNYPLIHTVGRASVRSPRLIDFTWGKAGAPRLTLVGKGVCFDTGGLDLKPSSGMLTMKKDMGGAAVVLGLAHMIMDAQLPVRLRVLIPAVENSVSGNAYRPGDVFRSRKGLTVEIGNTDAEGRLVLADALADGDDEAPDLMIDVATLTGAARAATGFDLPPFFTDDEALAAELYSAGQAVSDFVWRLPLWRGYESAIASPIADLNNSPDYNLAGAITAALFLNRFVTRAKSWMHLDIPAWIDRPKPGRRKGAEASAARALYGMLKKRYPPAA